MTEYTGFEDEAQSKTHLEGTVVDPTYAQYQGQIQAADSQHEAMMELARQNAALYAKLARYEAPVEVTSPSLGGAPVAHHLHLVDGRVIANHSGIGTHYSESIDIGPGPNGEYREPITKVTRIRGYYPADEQDPTFKYA